MAKRNFLAFTKGENEHDEVENSPSVEKVLNGQIPASVSRLRGRLLGKAMKKHIYKHDNTIVAE